MMVKLGDVCTVVSGSTPKSAIPEYWDGEMKWITPAELNDDSYIITDTTRHITQLGATKTGLKAFPAGTVILSSRAPIGKTAIAGCEMYCNQGFKNLICTEKIDNKYLYFFLTGKTSYLNSLGRGATFKEISKSIVENIEIPLPEMAEQQAIAGRFERLMRLIQLRKSELEHLDQLVKSRFVEMFGTVDNNVYGFKTSALVAVSSDFFAGGDKPTDCVITPDESHPFPVYANGYENEGLQGFSEKCRVTKEAVTVSARGTIGYCFLRKANFTPVVRLITIVPNKDVSVIYLKYAIEAMKIKSSGTSQAQLTVPAFKKEQIIVPPIELQNQFAAFVEQTEKSKLAVQQGLQELELLKKSLMQQYFG